MDNKKGFTLIEILITIVLLGFLLIAVLEAEALSIDNNYYNVYRLYSREILSYELSYAHIWANEGNINWNSPTPEQISCPGFGDSSVISGGSNLGDCLSINDVGQFLNIATVGTYSIPLPKDIGIFLYITPTTTHTQAEVYAFVLWSFSTKGVKSNLEEQDSEIFGSSSTTSPYYYIKSTLGSTSTFLNYLNGENTLQFNNAISGSDIITKLN
jgi:prepilin-type N-terminal cleavage/methylation domain-containing protein